MKEKIISLILCLAIVSSMFGVFTAPIAAQYDYVYLDVYANDPDGNPIDHADVFINDTWVGFTGEYFMVPNGSINKVFIQDLWEAGNTGYRYSVNRWEDSSTANPRNVVCTELETQITAYFGEKWCPGDVDGNCVVDDTDKSILVAAYGASRGDPDWDSRADVNGDGIVDIYDVPIVLTHYGYVYSKSEIRYMRGNTTTVNNLTAYQLSTNQSDTAKYNTYGGYGSCSVWWGIRVWERSSAGTETEITGGTPVALVSRSTSGEGIQSATWNCSETSLNTTDAIVVRVYIKVGANWSSAVATFITEQLGATKLDSATWTVYYYTKRYCTTATVGFFYWGTTTYNSRIENFTWSRLQN